MPPVDLCLETGGEVFGMDDGQVLGQPGLLGLGGEPSSAGGADMGKEAGTATAGFDGEERSGVDPFAELAVAACEEIWDSRNFGSFVRIGRQD